MAALFGREQVPGRDSGTMLLALRRKSAPALWRYLRDEDISSSIFLKI
jgi:hypothetical protein